MINWPWAPWSPKGSGSLRCNLPRLWGLAIRNRPSLCSNRRLSLLMAARACNLCASAFGLWAAALCATRSSPPSCKRVRLGVANCLRSCFNSLTKVSNNVGRSSSRWRNSFCSWRNSSSSLRKLSCSSPVKRLKGIANTASACLSVKSSCTCKLAFALALSRAD